MTKRELVQKLLKAGWTITHGKAHDLATNSLKPGIKITIPRHTGDSPKGTVESILKTTGLK